jgi:hypothetical protein
VRSPQASTSKPPEFSLHARRSTRGQALVVYLCGRQVRHTAYMCEQAVGSYRKAARYSEGRFPTGQPWRLCDFPATPAGHQVLRYAATPYEPKTSLLKMHGNHSCVAAVCSSRATASIHRSAKPGFLRVSTWVALLPNVLQRLAFGLLPDWRLRRCPRRRRFLFWGLRLARSEIWQTA